MGVINVCCFDNWDLEVRTDHHPIRVETQKTTQIRISMYQKNERFHNNTRYEPWGMVFHRGKLTPQNEYPALQRDSVFVCCQTDRKLKGSLDLPKSDKSREELPGYFILTYAGVPSKSGRL